MKCNKQANAKCNKQANVKCGKAVEVKKPTKGHMRRTSSASVTRQTRLRSLLNTYAASPNGVSFAMRTASASLEKRKSGATGPNVCLQQGRRQ